VERRRPDIIQRLLFWGALIVASHFFVVLEHLWLVVRTQPSFPRSAIPWLIVINLFPVIGLVVLAMEYRKLAAILIAAPLALAFAIGTYAHFLSPGTDNVLHMPPGELRVPFQVSAVLLALLEALGCWIGLITFKHSRENRV
jgi:hypothetical protein